MDTNTLRKWKMQNASTKFRFLKRTLSFSNSSVPKGYLAICVGEEMKRFVIPMEYLSYKAFRILLRKAEEEFGFYHQGILRIPCDVYVFEGILEIVEREKKGYCCFSMEIDFPYQTQELMCQ